MQSFIYMFMEEGYFVIRVGQGWIVEYFLQVLLGKCVFFFWSRVDVRVLLKVFVWEESYLNFEEGEWKLDL